MGALSRRPEAESVAAALASWRPILRLEPPATLDGGDVMHIGRTLFVGTSARTNAEGVRQLAALVEPFGCRVTPVPVRDCLHMKSACCPLGGDAILVNRAWLDVASFRGYRLIDVAPEEPWAANVLTIDETVVMPACYPATREIVERLGRVTVPVDVSELMKAEAGVTCMSIVFEARG
jgi:dimethylargininase